VSPRRAALPLAVAALLAPAAAAARPAVDLGLRLGWGAAVGSAAARVPMSEAIAWQAPIQLDALAHVGPSAAVGAYGSWAPAGVGGQACTDGASCSAQVARAGAQALWRCDPWAFGAAPWVGAALGWEWGWQRRERLGAVTTTGWSGPEVGVQAGAAWPLGARLALGPFALVGVGVYDRQSIETPEASASSSLADRAAHVWIQLGVRGTLGL
jgi:hypothetical protein